MKLKKTTAVLLALSAAVVSGSANFISKIAVTVVADPTVFTFLKNALVGILILGILLITRKYKEVRALTRSNWIRLLLIGIIGGSIPFIMYFTGLTMTSAVSASFIHKTMFIWVALLAIPFLKEKLSWIQGSALFLLVFGTLALSGNNAFSFGRGEALILGATLFWAVENIIAKKTLAEVSTSLVAGSRMVFGSLILFAVVVSKGSLPLIANLRTEQWWWTMAISALLFAYVILWLAALKRAPAIIVTSLLVPATIITNLLTLIFQGKPFSSPQLASALLMLGAVVLLFWQSRRSTFIQTHAQGTKNI